MTEPLANHCTKSLTAALSKAPTLTSKTQIALSVSKVRLWKCACALEWNR